MRTNRISCAADALERSAALGRRARSAYAVAPRPRPDAAGIIACRTQLLFSRNRESADKRLQTRLSDGHVKLDPDTVCMLLCMLLLIC